MKEMKPLVITHQKVFGYPKMCIRYRHILQLLVLFLGNCMKSTGLNVVTSITIGLITRENKKIGKLENPMGWFDTDCDDDVIC